MFRHMSTIFRENLCIPYSKSPAFTQLLVMVQWLRHKIWKIQLCSVYSIFTMVTTVCVAFLWSMLQTLKRLWLKSSIYSALARVWLRSAVEDAKNGIIQNYVVYIYINVSLSFISLVIASSSPGGRPLTIGRPYFNINYSLLYSRRYFSAELLILCFVKAGNYGPVDDYQLIKKDTATWI
jgi:hypothetical protein